MPDLIHRRRPRIAQTLLPLLLVFLARTLAASATTITPGGAPSFSPLPRTKTA